jgi:hypothetical protein
MKKLLLILTIWWFLLSPTHSSEPDFGLLIFNHQIAIGMSFANVTAAWGKPEKIDRSTHADRVIEYWFYHNSSWMVVFENGRVRSFHQ